MGLIQDILFTEKYRPINLDDIIMPSKFKKMFMNGLKQNVLLHGSPGTGKTTLAKALVKQFNHPYLLINCSTDGGVQTLRDTVPAFCETQSLQTSKKGAQEKVIILEEIDGASQAFYKGLRAVMETYPHIRFIGTCNYLTNVPEPLRDRRFIVIDFNFTEDLQELKSEFIKRILRISSVEGIKYRNEKDEQGNLISPIALMFERFYPDMGATLNFLQSLKKSGLNEVTANDIKSINVVNTELFDMILNLESSEELYTKILTEYSNNIELFMSYMANNFIDYILRTKTEYINLFPKFVIEIAEWQHKVVNMNDKILAPLAMVYKIQEIIKNNLKK